MTERKKIDRMRYIERKRERFRQRKKERKKETDVNKFNEIVRKTDRKSELY